MACNTDMLSENITKRSTKETFTYFKVLQIASTSGVKYSNHLLVYNSLLHKERHMQKLLFLPVLKTQKHRQNKNMKKHLTETQL